MNRTALGVGLALIGLTFLAIGLALGVLYIIPKNTAAEDEVAYLDEQGRLLLARLNNKVDAPSTPEPPQNGTPTAQPQVKPAAAVAKPKAPQPPVAAKPPPPPVNQLDHKEINAAIDNGVKYLKSHQNLNGTWGAGPVHAVGYAALPGLTLLECGVSPKDPVVQKAATFVRNNVPKLTTTYELSLAILFLDRLGETRDEGLIRIMAMRLVAGQTAAGGWDYHVPLLKPADSDELFALLQKNQLRSTNPLARGKGGPEPLATGADFKTQDPLAVSKDAACGISNTVATETPGKSAAKSMPKAASARSLPAHLQNIPALANLGKGKGKAVLRSGRDDNSNTQFALLALWTARRHGAPTDMSLLLAYQRYVTSQSPTGGWSYLVNNRGQTPSMTCVGLLGLALGHGSAPEAALDKASKVMGKNTNEDPTIQNGLKALGSYIGTPLPPGVKPPMENLYFLWSVERVAVLYNLKTIGGRDWYAWGARILLPNQAADGSWHGGRYHGSAPTIDTCFALLFLKRSNLIKDLSDSLQLMLAIDDPDAARR